MSNNTASSGTLERFGYEESFKRTLSLGSLVFYGLAYLAPMSIFSVYGIVDGMTHGMVALSYGIATIAMLFTAYSYGKNGRCLSDRGVSLFLHTACDQPIRRLPRGWSILMDYLLLPMLNCLLISLFLSPYFPGVPGWVWILAYVGLSTIINYFGINVTAWVNNLVIVAQLVFVLAFVIFISKWLLTGNGAATFFDAKGLFDSTELKAVGGWGTIVSGGSILALCFLGFDAISTVTEEAKDPEKNLEEATMITCIGRWTSFHCSFVFDAACMADGME